MKPVSDIDWARLAAFIDGEGCIYIKSRIRRKNVQHALEIGITNTDIRLLVWLKDTFGCGSITVSHHEAGNRKTSYVWRVSYGTAEQIIRGCFAYLILKREQAEIGLALRSTYVKVQQDKVDAETISAREKLKQQLHVLNFRGRNTSSSPVEAAS